MNTLFFSAGPMRKLLDEWLFVGGLDVGDLESFGMSIRGVLEKNQVK